MPRRRHLNPQTGLCDDPKKTDGSTCSDNDACTLTDTCQDGSCQSGTPKVCTAKDACHVAGTCNPANGTCTDVAGNDNAACDFGDMCKTGKTCLSGACQGGTDKTCSDGNDCTDDTCNSATGCVFTIDTTNSCSDGNLCTESDACNAQGTCAGTAKTCTALDQCHDVGTCDTQTGNCSNPNKTDGTLCNDGVFCTTNESCQGGTCQDGTTTACTTTDQCKVATGTCDSVSDKCIFDNATDGTACTGFSHKPAECVDANTIRTYTSVGGCVAGACEEKYTDATCALGCAAGVCKHDLQITEYVEGSGTTNKAIEITNLSGSPIDLSQCKVRL
ncbi:MAG TPA: lamin tail domain-containing protein, partial [Polyangiaceae bacterium]|nr:lamin tail domain-containing protein [Polyangiaceae bacterium]